MEIKKADELQISDFGLYKMVDAFNKNPNRKVKMGKSFMKHGARVPYDGMSSHDEDEYSYVIKGSLSAHTENVSTVITSGDFGFIPKGTKHWCKNEGDEDCELIWILVGEQ